MQYKCNIAQIRLSEMYTTIKKLVRENEFARFFAELVGIFTITFLISTVILAEGHMWLVNDYSSIVASLDDNHERLLENDILESKVTATYPQIQIRPSADKGLIPGAQSEGKKLAAGEFRKSSNANNEEHSDAVDNETTNAIILRQDTLDQSNLASSQIENDSSQIVPVAVGTAVSRNVTSRNLPSVSQVNADPFSSTSAASSGSSNKNFNVAAANSIPVELNSTSDLDTSLNGNMNVLSNAPPSGPIECPPLENFPPQLQEGAAAIQRAKGCPI